MAETSELVVVMTQGADDELSSVAFTITITRIVSSPVIRRGPTGRPAHTTNEHRPDRQAAVASREEPGERAPV